MVCVSPPEPDDTSLWAYLDGEADLDVQAHLQQCPHCRQRAEQLAAFERRVKAGLYRAACPTPHELGEYHLGLLGGDQAAAVARHLAGCPNCTQEVAQLQGFLDTPASAQEPARGPGLLEQIREQVRVLVAQWVPAGAGLAPAMAGMRGGEGESRLYQADGVEVTIGIQPDAEHPGHSSILGLVIGLESTGAVAYLWRGHQQIATAPVDDLDSFVLPSIPPGTYQLVLSGPEIEIVIHELEIGPRSGQRNPDSQE
jgi:anti-sigma factor ChrR (cupin superfamily)